MESDSAQEAVIMQTAFLTGVLEDMDATRMSRDRRLQVFMYVFVIIIGAAGIALCLHVERKILLPFGKLQYFARRIAAGDLDMPLEMDKGNIFGAFTESFDIMREEIKTARENEIKADKSKKELVASLVHDITTPVASVRSAMDVLRLKTGNGDDIKLLDSASKKLEQIDTLLTDMFHSTLEEADSALTLAKVPFSSKHSKIKSAISSFIAISPYSRIAKF